MANLGSLLVFAFCNFLQLGLVVPHTFNNLDLGHENESYEID